MSYPDPPTPLPPALVTTIPADASLWRIHSAARGAATRSTRYAGRSRAGRPSRPARLQVIEQRLGFDDAARVEAFGEPALGRGEEVASVRAFAVIAPQAREDSRGAQLQLVRGPHGAGRPVLDSLLHTLTRRAR